MIFHNGIAIDRKTHTITHNFNSRHFTGKYNGGRQLMFRTWEAMILGDMSAAELFECLYGEDPNGGPMFGLHIFYVRIAQWEPELKRMQLRIIRDKRAGQTYYKMVPNVV